jgi:hypothetical protein
MVPLLMASSEHRQCFMLRCSVFFVETHPVCILPVLTLLSGNKPGNKIPSPLVVCWFDGSLLAIYYAQAYSFGPDYSPLANTTLFFYKHIHICFVT